MARLQVGNVRIDGSDVSVGTPAPAGTGRPADASVPGGDPGFAIRTLERIPVSAGLLAVVGIACMAAGTAINVMLSAWTNPAAALLGGGVLAPVGAGLLVAGAAKRFILRRAHLRHRAALGREWQRHRDTLRTLLSGTDPRQTVEWIAARTGWPEAAVLHTLALLREEGALTEELDTTSGAFHYTCRPVPAAATPYDLTTRLDTLSTRPER
jgi:hypothetical protein